MVQLFDPPTASLRTGIHYRHRLFLNVSNLSAQFENQLGIIDPNYSLLYTQYSGSTLTCNISRIKEVLGFTYNVIHLDSIMTAASWVRCEIDRIDSGEFKIGGKDTKARIKVNAAVNSTIDINTPSTATDSTYLVRGFYKTSLSGSNIRHTAVSGHSNTKLYLDAGTGLESSGTYNLDLSGVSGQPVDVFVIGRTITNNTPILSSANYTLNCGAFESASAIKVPII